MRKSAAKTKSINNSQLETKKLKNVDSPYELFRGLFGSSESKTLLYVSNISKEIIIWAHGLKENRDPLSSYSIPEFRIEQGIPERVWEDWLTRYPFFKEAVEETRTILGVIRLSQVAHGKFSVPVFMRDQYRYSKEWDEADKREHAMKQDENKIKADVILHRFLDRSNGNEANNSQHDKGVPVHAIHDQGNAESDS